MLPARRKHNTRKAYKAREYPGHRKWVRGFPCLVPGCEPNLREPETMVIQAAHVRRNTDGGTALKPHDRWVVPLCMKHHKEQHRADLTFEAKYRVDTREKALEYAAKSPHRFKWLEADND